MPQGPKRHIGPLREGAPFLAMSSAGEDSGWYGYPSKSVNAFKFLTACHLDLCTDVQSRHDLPSSTWWGDHGEIEKLDGGSNLA